MVDLYFIVGYRIYRLLTSCEIGKMENSNHINVDFIDFSNSDNNKTDIKNELNG
ncbi:hypothetical protein MARI151_10644 [Maribacter litoralis]|uniref:Uncharacterized protein n=1 Tax=Maribacter litoralis TaxID=2059726 RepID=A0A653NCZ9_9FLAO|nr:hypothetical protein MARI151_10644 [Maribacter litoralis]